MCIDPAVDEVAELRQLRDLYRAYDLGCMVNAFPGHEEDMRPLLEFAGEMDACMVNVISGVMPMRPEDAVAVVRRWMGEATSAGVPLLFETHRDGLLNDLYFTLQLMDLVPDMRLCADLSHFVVDREMRGHRLVVEGRLFPRIRTLKMTRSGTGCGEGSRGAGASAQTGENP